MLCFEKAAELLTPDISFANIMKSIKHIPVPVQINPELCVRPNPPGITRPEIHFSESELALLNLSLEMGFTRAKLKAVIETISKETFNVKDFSSDLFAKIDRAKINNIKGKVLIFCTYYDVMMTSYDIIITS